MIRHDYNTAEQATASFRTRTTALVRAYEYIPPHLQEEWATDAEIHDRLSIAVNRLHLDWRHHDRPDAAATNNHGARED
eukprot:3672085-Prorocentrum_lima.AAC.1